jgi:hypothetical protein
MVATIKLQIRKETRTLLPAFHLRRARRGELGGGLYRSLISDDFVQHVTLPSQLPDYLSQNWNYLNGF